MISQGMIRFTLCRFKVGIDLLWLIPGFFISWALAENYFPGYYGELSNMTCWFMGITGVLGMLFSILLHELAHCIIARRFNVKIEKVTLQFFGGIAEIDDEPSNAKAEFFIAAAGPVLSIIFFTLFHGAYLFGKASGWPVSLYGLCAFLSVVNGILAGFNLLPAFPLDGGRMVRSALWSFRKNIGWATRISARIGIFLSLALLFSGAINALLGNTLYCILSVVTGIFLWYLSRTSFEQEMLYQSMQFLKKKQ